MALLELEPDRTIHPVDIIEHIAAINDWNFERQDADEISISVRGDLERLPRLVQLDAGPRSRSTSPPPSI